MTQPIISNKTQFVGYFGPLQVQFTTNSDPNEGCGDCRLTAYFADFILNASAPLRSVNIFVEIMFFLMKTENMEVSSKANIRRDDNNKQNQAKKS